MAGCETGECDCPTICGRTYHRRNCWPLHNTACGIDPKQLENIDPNYGGPTREECEARFVPGREGFGGF